jgi:glutaconyl-CoA/methylmalonyl-CoA decarboxylase subunit gamma
MKNYRITVNQEVYHVTVEEVQSGTMPVPSATSIPTPAPKPTSAPVPASKPAPTAAPASKSASANPVAANVAGLKIQAPMPGKVLALKVSPGEVVKSGTVLLVLEAMKMENDIMAPKDGTIKAVAVSAGAAVTTGEVLIVME